MKFKKIPLIKYKFKKNIIKKVKWYYIIIYVIIFLIILFGIKLTIFRKNSFFNKNEPFKIMLNLPRWNYTDLIKNYFDKIPNKYRGEKSHELYILKGYFRLKSLSEDGNSLCDNKTKMELYNKFGGIKYSKQKNIYIRDNWKFGNRMIFLNNMIYYYQILGEDKNIYINSAHHWFLKDKIILDHVNISIVNDSTMNCNDNETFCVERCPYLLTPKVIKTEIRLGLIKSELMKNLPKVETDPKDLYIHIRSGDIYKNPHASYSQPPLCFYKSIIDNIKFRKIYIITENNKSPIIEKLIEEYPQINLNYSSVMHDISALINAYNMVGSVSSFAQVCLILNENIENYYEYDIYRKLEKFRHLHHECYKYPRSFNIYQMKPSEYYQGEMYLWVNSGEQRKLMLEEKCDFSQFKLIKT